jgi:hypothetical protein
LGLKAPVVVVASTVLVRLVSYDHHAGTALVCRFQGMGVSVAV